MLSLKCVAQNYAWGKYPPESEVAELFGKNHDVEDVDPTQPYAEFWMGTHPSGPSSLADTGETLQEWIERHPESLGPAVQERFQNQLPFLFKVLSVRTALSIQSHPDKALAEQLHTEHPELYKDPNHKPEMAIALTDFEALCGFASFEEIVHAFEQFPEMKQCVQETSLQNMSLASPVTHAHVLQQVFTELMLCSSEISSAAIDALMERISQKRDEDRSEKERLLLILNAQYPQDIGLLAACFLNYVKLHPGEAIYLPANEPHAYIVGDIVECMATSDNVIRAGLTPKLRDTTVLCNSLTYSMGMPTILKGEKDTEDAVVYRPPFEEFEVRRISPSAGQGHYIIPSNHGPSLLFVYRGEGILMQRPSQMSSEGETSVPCKSGDVWFLPASISVEFRSNGDLVIWQARVHASVFSDA